MCDSSVSYTEASQFDISLSCGQNWPQINKRFDVMQFIANLQVPCLLPQREDAACNRFLHVTVRDFTVQERNSGLCTVIRLLISNNSHMTRNPTKQNGKTSMLKSLQKSQDFHSNWMHLKVRMT
ncbi:hypothetical protein AVEN_60344-1 [Araneus ventricosus]|uniref:Uncharacterized protein n=1 Tax=Araneus ventricosus TaxID=182803 RepID=A0A4Y2T1A2_ARAVE|nr:hypothetical protein AVEN_60344-1 [Araneus ventricosus]